ncbi:MAG: Gfo/Idh/MocA family oxidoreductase [Caldilineaceae bacterium]
MDNVPVVLVGAGGYGGFYLRAFAEKRKATEQGATLVGVVDPTPLREEVRSQLDDLHVPLYSDLATCFAAQPAQLVVIAAPIHFHRPYTLAALAQGANVLCEKPLCATIQEAQAMVAAQRTQGPFVAVGYQWSFSAAIQALKEDILSGVLGKPLRFKASVLWPRTATYYGRNNWAGHLTMPNGGWVLDSPVSNATAHYLHNLFYLLGESRTEAAQPVTIEAELYRANSIQNCDTAALRCTTARGVEILYYTSHAIPENRGPYFDLEFEKAVVTYRCNGGGRSTAGPIVGRFYSGQAKVYGDPFADETRKLWESVAAARGGAAVACNVTTATAHVRAVNGMHESMPVIQAFPADLVRQQEGLTWVTGLQEQLAACYDQNLLPSEADAVPWACAGQMIDLQSYDHFPQSPLLQALG